MDLALPRACSERFCAEVVDVFMAVELEEIARIGTSGRDCVHRQANEHVARNLLNGECRHSSCDLRAVHVAERKCNGQSSALAKHASAVWLQRRQEAAEC